MLPKTYELLESPRRGKPSQSQCDRLGTSSLMVERLKPMEATHTWKTFMHVWALTFGVPDIIVADPGSSEFIAPWPYA